MQSIRRTADKNIERTAHLRLILCGLSGEESEMKNLCKALAGFVRNVSGATLAEYGIALIVAVVVGSAAITQLADAVGNELSETASAF